MGTGKRSPSRRESFDSSATIMFLLLFCARTFSLKRAPPPPFYEVEIGIDFIRSVNSNVNPLRRIEFNEIEAHGLGEIFRSLGAWNAGYVRKSAVS